MKQADFISLGFDPAEVKPGKTVIQKWGKPQVEVAAAAIDHQQAKLQFMAQRQFEINQKERQRANGLTQGFVAPNELRTNMGRSVMPLLKQEVDRTEHVVRAVTSEYERRIDSMRAQIQRLESEREKPVERSEIEPAIKEQNQRKIRL